MTSSSTNQPFGESLSSTKNDVPLYTNYPAQEPEKNLSLWIQVILGVFTAVVTSIVTFYSVTGSLKDGISQNRTQISVLNEKANSLNQKVNVNDSRVQNINRINTNQQVLKVRLEELIRRVDNLSSKK
ncbi:MAG: hypothetical protein DSZ27_02175 [Thiomicrospira sp.]|nr:MAG: hypothetical protein DSZ27_02175 [Thiomicrospira sp.]